MSTPAQEGAATLQVMDAALTADPRGRWAALDEPDEWEAFSRPVAGAAGLWESWLAVEGMHCAACAPKVEEALGALPGVRGVEVGAASHIARVTWEPASGSPSAWFPALVRAGYTGMPAQDMLPAAERRREARVMLWRWLVAGFCMMQVMMYAFPAYIAQPGDITPDVEALLRWASWVLTLPVVLFCCKPFFASAARDLRAGRAGMDVPVALGIAIAFGASTAATFDPSGPLGGEVWFDSLTMFVFFLLSARLLELRLRDRTAGALEALMRRLPECAARLTDAGVEMVPVRRLRAGDRVRVLPGEAFPADGTVLEGASSADEALLTGESRPVARREGDTVTAGSFNLTGTLVVRVDAAGAATRYAGIVALMEQASLQKPALARAADRVAGPFLWVVMAAAAGAAAWWWSSGASGAIGVAVAVLIVTCPCALSLATPAATLATAGFLARRGILVRRLDALEAAATIDTVLFDKTGTLTRDRLDVTGGLTRAGLAAQDAWALAAALAANSLHPVSRAIVAACPVPVPAAQDVRETAGAGLSGTVSPAGGPPVSLRLGSAAFCGIEAPAGLADADTSVHLADGQGWAATFRLEEVLREDAPRAVAALRGRGIGVEMLSGDRPASVERVARRCGIAQRRGAATPQDKLARIEALQREGHAVLMAGDGLNDGPVLARADVSVAAGGAVPLAQSRADVAVPGGQVSAVPLLLAQARRTRRVVRQNLAWALAYNAVCVPLAVAGLMPPWLAGLGMAFSSLAVVLNSARLARGPSGA